MDYNLILQKEVIEKLEVNHILTPIDRGNGHLEKVSISELRDNLNTCIFSISESFKKTDFLLNYIEDYNLELKASKIPSKKSAIKRLKKRITNLYKNHPNLDINNDTDFKMMNKINTLEWQLATEKYILIYLKEQKYFIRNWISEKRKELSEKQIKEWIEKEKTKIETKKIIARAIKIIPKPQKDYLELGSLFAQGYIKKDKHIFYYQQKPFSILQEISDYIKDEVLVYKVNNTRQYIGNTLSNKGGKNFYGSKRMMKNIIKFCNENDIIISTEFQSIYDNLIK